MQFPATDSRHQLSASSPVGNTLQEIATMELDFATAELGRFAADPGGAIHQCRRSIKRLRALVRLGVAVPGARARSLDRRLRKAARVLAPIRDASEARRTLEQVLNAHPELESLKRLEILSGDEIDTNVSIKKAHARLEEARALLPEFFAAREAWNFVALATGIEASYERSAAKFYRFSGKHTDAIGHAWRKQVQCLANQLKMIKPLSDGFLSSSLKQLSKLADVLGEHNDLSVLRGRLKTHRSELPKKTYKTLREVARVDQRRVREEAITIGDDLFGLSPEVFRELILAECSDTPADPDDLRTTS